MAKILKNDQGLSLVQTIIAGGLLAVIMAMAFKFLNTQRKQQRSSRIAQEVNSLHGNVLSFFQNQNNCDKTFLNHSLDKKTVITALNLSTALGLTPPFLSSETYLKQVIIHPVSAKIGTNYFKYEGTKNGKVNAQSYLSSIGWGTPVEFVYESKSLGSGNSKKNIYGGNSFNRFALITFNNGIKVANVAVGNNENTHLCNYSDSFYRVGPSKKYNVNSITPGTNSETMQTGEEEYAPCFEFFPSHPIKSCSLSTTNVQSL